jgi:hypothetical protein
MLSRRFSCVLAFSAWGLALASRPAWVAAGAVGAAGALDSSPLQIVNSTVVLNQGEKTAAFDLQFNHTPDFYTLDSAGRVEDSFQYFINPDWTGNTQDLQLAFGQFRDVVRGDEIHTSGKLLIRDATIPANPDPTSGGWGPVIAAEPFHVNGDNLTFAASFNDLRAPKGTFSYEVYTTHFGGTVSTVQGWAVPLPPAAFMGMAMFGAMGAILGLRKIRQHRLTTNR